MKLTHQLHRVNLPKIFIALLLATAIFSCQRELHFDKVPEKDHNLILKFKPVATYDSVPLVLGKTYTNNFKEQYTPTGFKFYIHNIQLLNTDSGKIFTPKDKYYLIDFSDSTTTEIKITIEPYVYNRISFTIGVDSARNVSGAQTDALDPANGMFWTWNTGYIMAKLEGTSPKSPQAGKFEFHIGGFSGADNVIKTVSKLFPYPTNLEMKAGKESVVYIACDANAWFFQPWDIKIADNPVITSPGLLATQVAENYSNKGFTVDSVYTEQ